jgi:DNA-binding NarL/FixJ family response regulator
MMTRPKTTVPEAPTGTTPRRVFLVDDHPMFVLGLSRLIADAGDLEVCGHAPSSREALSALRLVQADLVIVDISLDGTNGLQLLKHLTTEHPDCPILVMSSHEERQYAPRALRAGASGYLMKQAEAEEMIAAMRRVLEGGIALSSAYREQVLFDVARGRATTPVDALSDRELEVLQLVGEGRSTKEIADRLILSTKTVESHRLHVREKLQLASAAEMVRFAVEWTGQGLLVRDVATSDPAP